MYIISDELKEKWASHDFNGDVNKSIRGFHYTIAYHNVLGEYFYYIFEADSFIDEYGFKNGASELIFIK